MRARSALLLGGLLLALAGGCSSRPSASVVTPPGLLPSLQATTYGDSVAFVLQVTNTRDEAVELEFRSGQEFDFVVEREGGGEVWRWSADRMFTQAVQHRTLPAGETLTYAASWIPPAGLSGEFLVRGLLVADDARVEQAARFRIP